VVAADERRRPLPAVAGVTVDERRRPLAAVAGGAAGLGVAVADDRRRGVDVCMYDMMHVLELVSIVTKL
jgi:hypothetical protein